MIQRYDAYSEGQEDDGRFVFYEDHLAELGFKESELAEKDAEIKQLTSERDDFLEALRVDYVPEVTLTCPECDCAFVRIPPLNLQVAYHKALAEIERLKKCLEMAL